MFTLRFWKATVERTVRTAAATLAGFVVADQSVTDVDWGQAGGVTAGAALATVLLALASSAFGGDGPGLTETVRKDGER